MTTMSQEQTEERIERLERAVKTAEGMCWELWTALGEKSVELRQAQQDIEHLKTKRE